MEKSNDKNIDVNKILDLEIENKSERFYESLRVLFKSWLKSLWLKEPLGLDKIEYWDKKELTELLFNLKLIKEKTEEKTDNLILDAIDILLNKEV